MLLTSIVLFYISSLQMHDYFHLQDEAAASQHEKYFFL